jgi:hypothetical protein
LTCGAAQVAELTVAFGFFLKGLHTAVDAWQCGVAKFVLVRGSTRAERLLSLVFLAACVLFAADVLQLAKLWLALAAITSYAYLVWFALCFTEPAKLILLLKFMVFRDLPGWTLILAVSIGAFTTVLALLEENGTEIRSFWSSFFTGLASIIDSELIKSACDKDVCIAQIFTDAHAGTDRAGDTSAPCRAPSVMPLVLLCVKLAFLFLGSVVLINLVQALMTNTMEEERGRLEKLAMLERARIIRHIESTMSDARRLQAPYWHVDEASGAVTFSVELSVRSEVETTRSSVRKELERLMTLLKYDAAAARSATATNAGAAGAAATAAPSRANASGGVEPPQPAPAQPAVLPLQPAGAEGTPRRRRQGSRGASASRGTR